MPVTFTTAIDKSVSTTSHSTSKSSLAIRIINLLEGVSSHSTKCDSSVAVLLDLQAAIESYSATLASQSNRSGINYEGREASASYSTTLATEIDVLIDLIAEITSHSAISSSESNRSGVGYEGREPDPSYSSLSSSNATVLLSLVGYADSHSSSCSSFVYNERTSLEMVDFDVTWDNSETVWYTNWFQESRITGDEDELAIRSLVVDTAKEPCATVVVQYDRNGDGTVDEQSHPIELGRKQQIRNVDGVPVDEDGYYRFKIMEYSGYNSLYNLNMAIVN